MKQNEKGVITVTLSMILFVMMVFVGTLIECVRISLAKSYSKECLTLSAESLLADYEPNMYKYYHIFVLDTNAVNDIENRIEKYATSSFYNDNLLSMQINDVSSCKVSYVSSNKNKYIKEQILKYMKYHGKSSGEKALLAEYLITHFSSYADTAPNSCLKKEKIYELEYIIAGKSEDNDNVLAVTSCMADFDPLNYSKTGYQNNIKNMLMSLPESTIITRTCNLMLSNINNNCKTNIQLQRCVSDIEVQGKFNLDGKFAIRKVNEYEIENIVKVKY